MGQTRAGAGRFGALGGQVFKLRSSERGGCYGDGFGFGPPWRLLPRPLPSPFASYILID